MNHLTYGLTSTQILLHLLHRHGALVRGLIRSKPGHITWSNDQVICAPWSCTAPPTPLPLPTRLRSNGAYHPPSLPPLYVLFILLHTGGLGYSILTPAPPPPSHCTTFFNMRVRFSFAGMLDSIVVSYTFLHKSFARESPFSAGGAAVRATVWSRKEALSRE